MDSAPDKDVLPRVIAETESNGERFAAVGKAEKKSKMQVSFPLAHMRFANNIHALNVHVLTTPCRTSMRRYQYIISVTAICL